MRTGNESTGANGGGSGRTGAGRRRLIGVFSVTAVLLTVVGFMFSSAQAASAVTPQSGPKGKVVVGTHNGTRETVQTMLFKVDLNGTASFMFCIDLNTVIEFGVTYDESAWDASKVRNLHQIARILSQTTATSTLDPIEIAAAQSAIWHFSDGFELDTTSGKNDSAVIERYKVLVKDATDSPVKAEPAGTLKVSPTTASASQGKPAFFDISTTATGPLSLELSDVAVTAHPATGSVCDLTKAITTITGSSRICLTSTSTRSDVALTVRTGAAPLSAGRVFIRPGRQKLIIGKAGIAQSNETVTASWAANARPTVAVECPSAGVEYGADTTFTANGSDADGDELTYQWSLNGAPLPGATNAEVTLALALGSKLTVTVTDTSGQTASATMDCPGRNKPSVAIKCPTEVVSGAANTFTAVGTDPDGDTLTYQWSLNGKLLNSTGPSLTQVVTAGDLLVVQAIDSTGLVSAEVTADCIGPVENQPPTVLMECPTNLVYGSPASFTATGSDPDDDPLTYTWSINGEPVAGATGPTASLTVNKGDKVSVVANDGAASSAPAISECDGTTPNHPPTVKVSCPADLIWGEPTVLTATGDDPDGDALTFQWTINGTEVKDNDGDRLEVSLDRGDIVGVTVTDGGNATSAIATANCEGTNRPEVSLECPTSPLIFGEPIEFTAVAKDSDGDPLTFEWTVNGKTVDGQTTSAATLSVKRDDIVAVSASDDHGAKAAASPITCSGTSRPTVTITCPIEFVAGEPAIFIANGVDPDGDTELAYVWWIDDMPVDGATGPKLTTTLTADQTLTVTVTDSKGATSQLAAANCTAENRPTVALTCPKLVTYGEPVEFTASGTDAEGEPLTFEWSINGTVVEGATGGSAQLTLDKGDTVSVVAIDDTELRSAIGTSDCVGNSKPTVKVACPNQLVVGEPAIFEATGTDDDGDSLTYTWWINDRVVGEANGPQASLAVESGDVVKVSAADPTGAESSEITFDCEDLTRPTVTLTCPAPITYGEPVEFTAVPSEDTGKKAVFTWAINGKLVKGATGALAELTVAAGDVVSVNSTGSNGLTSATVAISCSGETPTKPTKVVQPIPSTPQVLGSVIANATRQAGYGGSSLPFTGGDAVTMVLIAFAALAAGLGLVRFGRRRNEE